MLVGADIPLFETSWNMSLFMPASACNCYHSLPIQSHSNRSSSSEILVNQEIGKFVLPETQDIQLILRF